MVNATLMWRQNHMTVEPVYSSVICVLKMLFLSPKESPNFSLKLLTANFCDDDLDESVF